MSTQLPDTAIILAGGFGTRLQSVVSDVPKPLAPIGNRTFLHILLDHLIEKGVKHFILAVGYKGSLIEDTFGDRYRKCDVRYSYEHEPLGTGGAVMEALELHNSNDAVWILNGDTFFDCDLQAVAKTHLDKQADVTLALCAIEQADRYGLVELDERHYITCFREKEAGASGLINAGVYLLNPEAVQRFDFPTRFSLEKEFFEKFLLDLRLIGSPQAGYFIDIGIPADYEKAQSYFEK